MRRDHVSVGKHAARDGRHVDVIVCALHGTLRPCWVAVGFCKGRRKSAGVAGRRRTATGPLSMMEGLPLGQVLAWRTRWLVPCTTLDVECARPDRRSIHGPSRDHISGQPSRRPVGGSVPIRVYTDFRARSAVLDCRPVVRGPGRSRLDVPGGGKEPRALCPSPEGCLLANSRVRWSHGWSAMHQVQLHCIRPAASVSH